MEFILEIHETGINTGVYDESSGKQTSSQPCSKKVISDKFFASCGVGH